jgi:hypothetical protein
LAEIGPHLCIRLPFPHASWTLGATASPPPVVASPAGRLPRRSRIAAPMPLLVRPSPRCLPRFARAPQPMTPPSIVAALDLCGPLPSTPFHVRYGRWDPFLLPLRWDPLLLSLAPVGSSPSSLAPAGSSPSPAPALNTSPRRVWQMGSSPFPAPVGSAPSSPALAGAGTRGAGWCSGEEEKKMGQFYVHSNNRFGIDLVL